jgi:hypothetical protein
MAAGDDLFLRPGTVDVDAAVIGIGRARWVALEPEDASTENAIQIMERNRFDVLPIHGGSDKPIYEYFHTQHWGKWNHETVVRNSITFKDVLPAQTPLIALIEKFVKGECLFFFLAYEHRVAGLVSVANLNSRQVKFYLYALVCELETCLSRLISDNKVDEAVLFSKLDEKGQRNYQEDQEKGFENNILQYLCLSSLLDIVRCQSLFEELGYPSKKQFEKLNTLNELRNQIMHPVRSLVHDKDSLGKLWERIEKLQDALFRLRQLQASE